MMYFMYSLIGVVVGILLGCIATLTMLDGDDKIARKAKRLRNINIKLLGINGLLYRLHVLLLQFIFFWLVTGKWGWSIGISTVWSGINMILYYNWHYWFARLFTIGKINES